jgi:hypothetical protein
MEKKSLLRRSIYFFPLITFFAVSALYFSRSGLTVKKSITKISQHSLQKEALSNLYLAELLDLSYDKKVTREEFDLEDGVKKLLSSPCIDEAKVTFIDDTHIQVSYNHVNIVALIGDFKNRGIDEKGRIFPIKPFFSPKGLVTVFLGIKEVKEENFIDGYEEKSRWIFAKRFLKDLLAVDIEGKVTFLDVSKIEEKSLGKNEIILKVDYFERTDILRLSKRNYLNEIQNYIILTEKLKHEKGQIMIDFRLDSLAFIEKY